MCRRERKPLNRHGSHHVSVIANVYQVLADVAEKTGGDTDKRVLSLTVL